jgi:hypothetical protein
MGEGRKGGRVWMRENGRRMEEEGEVEEGIRGKGLIGGGVGESGGGGGRRKWREGEREGEGREGEREG